MSAAYGPDAFRVLAGSRPARARCQPVGCQTAVLETLACRNSASLTCSTSSRTARRRCDPPPPRRGSRHRFPAARNGKSQTCSLTWAKCSCSGPLSSARVRPPTRRPRTSSATRLPRATCLAWSADATDRLILELRNAGPNRMCWTWWEASGAPMTSGAVARHQIQEAAVHAYDAQQASRSAAASSTSSRGRRRR